MENATLIATRVLSRARSAGIRFSVDHDNLLLEADSPPAPTLIDELSEHKREIIRLLALENEAWNVEEWRSFFDHRTRLAMANAGKTLAAARAMAFNCCVIEWLNNNPAPSAPGRCAHCGKQEQLGQAVVPFGIKRHDHTWLHTDCWSAWHGKRCDCARQALDAFGIRVEEHDHTRAKFPDEFEKKEGA